MARSEKPSAQDVAARIRALNDAFRTTLSGGRLMVTSGVQALGPVRVAVLAEKMRAFDEFTEGDDPYGEHDFGAFDDEGQRFLWKIDYYDPGMEFGSEDPADPAKTCRVLTLMLAEEY